MDFRFNRHMAKTLRVVIIKPSKYTTAGHVERFRWGFMPNSTVPYLRSMVPTKINETSVETYAIDEYVRTDVDYLSLLTKKKGYTTLVVLVGVQSHQFHRALDLAAVAHRNGCLSIIGGPHPMTCDTSMLQGRGISFALAEAELVWLSVLNDAIAGELRPTYGQAQRWAKEIDAPVLVPPTRADLKRYVIPMLGVYPARGCPFVCNYCSVIKIAGRRIRAQSIETTIESLRLAQAAGVRLVMFTSDNFNKYPQASDLLNAMIDARLGLKFFVQCDTQISRQEQLVALLAQAGCFQIFVGVESFDRNTLVSVKKLQNKPELYKTIVELCRKYRISSHFSNIIGFPNSTAGDIEHHLDALLDIDPTWASFYILCPIPGTEQYADFIAKDLIYETNLDRFDTTCLTWKHSHMSARELEALLFLCYRKFFSLKHTLSAYRTSRRDSFSASDFLITAGNALFHRYSVFKRTHPMSGGIRRVVVDNAEDFLPLRQKTFDFELAPLPQNLALPETDQLSNDPALRTNGREQVVAQLRHSA